MKNLLFLLMVLLIGCNTREEKKDERLMEVSINGERLFKSNCANCHKPDKDFTGPALIGIYERWEDKKLLFEYIRNSTKIIAENKYAKALHEKWSKLVMPSFTLTDSEIKSILDYCYNEDSLQK